MKIIHTTYLGDLRTEATHLQSGSTIITDAPTDNQGKGAAFSPTDLLAASLGSCMLTIMGIAARTHGISIEGTHMHITKTMSSQPRRVAGVHVTFEMGGTNYTEKEKHILENAARTCPVALSLHPDLKQELAFIYK